MSDAPKCQDTALQPGRPSGVHHAHCHTPCPAMGSPSRWHTAPRPPERHRSGEVTGLQPQPPRARRAAGGRSSRYESAFPSVSPRGRLRSSRRHLLSQTLAARGHAARCIVLTPWVAALPHVAGRGAWASAWAPICSTDTGVLPSVWPPCEAGRLGPGRRPAPQPRTSASGSALLCGARRLRQLHACQGYWRLWLGPRPPPVPREGPQPRGCSPTRGSGGLGPGCPAGPSRSWSTFQRPHPLMTLPLGTAQALAKRLATAATSICSPDGGSLTTQPPRGE